METTARSYGFLFRLFSKSLFTKQKRLVLKYRWVVDEVPTAWQTLKTFRSEADLKYFMRKRSNKEQDWIEYKVI